jgi:ATP-dependent helicase/nuclease subunit A
LQARKKMVARLGAESIVPIEELLNAALQFVQNHGVTLQAFLAWFESGDSEVKREGVSGSDEVRILTVHGSKGLQAPVVILADITSDPKMKPADSSELLIEDGSRLPLLNIRKAECFGRLDSAVKLQNKRELEEHFRLLYVAITRAQERLVMAGALGVRSKGAAAPESWYTAILAGMEALGSEWQSEAPWGRVMRYEGSVTAGDIEKLDDKNTDKYVSALPLWLTKEAPKESRPPRPLVPSQIGGDDYGEAPPSAIMRIAAEKGLLIHALFERASSDNHALFEQNSMEWLLRNNAIAEIDNAEIITSVRKVIDNPEWTDFFGVDAHSEVPLAAVVGETVITGRVDRLVVSEGVVRVLDFKTGRIIPRSAESLPVATLRQMAHYVAALELIFPEHKVEASLLFTHGPVMMMLRDIDLAAHKPAS